MVNNTRSLFGGPLKLLLVDSVVEIMFLSWYMLVEYVWEV